MRFTDVVNVQTMLTMPDAAFAAAVNGWAHDMGKRFGYRRETRMEHWQEAIDIVYTALEAHLRTTDPSRIQSHSKWAIMMLAAKVNFPEHIDVYHPTLVDQQRTRRMIKNSQMTRLIKNKLELMAILKKGNDLTFKTLQEVALSRLQCELLAASAERLVLSYLGSQTEASRFSYGTAMDTTCSGPSADHSLASMSAVSKTEYSAAASAFAKYDTGARELGHNWTGRLQTGLGATASAQASGEAKAKLGALVAAANAGLGVETGAKADVDLEICHSCKVSHAYLRRILGPEFQTFAARGLANTGINAGASANIALSTRGGLKHKYERDPLGDDEVPGFGRPKLSLFNATAEAQAELAVTMRVQGGITIGQSLDVEMSGDLKASLGGNAELKCFINGTGVGMDAGYKLFAGFEAGTDQTVTVKHPSRNISIFSLSARESVTFGAGLDGELKGRATIDQIGFTTGGGVTLGLGSSIETNALISPRGVLLFGYDFLAAPIIMALAEQMSRRHSGVHTQRLQRFANFLNISASGAEVTQVYLDCQTRLNSALALLDSEAEKIYKSSPRAPGMTYGPAATDDEVAMEVEGTSQSKYYDYTTETMKTDPLTRVFGSEADAGNPSITFLNPPGEGMRGQPVTQEFIISQRMVRGGQLANVVDIDKQALHSVVSAYERAKNNGSGACISYNVLRNDLLRGRIHYS